jgi:hypothetical protein
MKCLARKPNKPAVDALSFLQGLFDNSACSNEAVYLDPIGRPLCEPCALERKKNHEEGTTPLAIYQRTEYGRIKEYYLRPINMTVEESEVYLRAQSVNVEQFLERAHARSREMIAKCTDEERRLLRQRFANNPKVLALIDSAEVKESSPS